jgi:hypothetical protein
MRYYIRHDKDTKVEGPFTIEQLTEGVRTGRISPEALASSDLGDNVADLQVWRGCDWFPLAAIDELREVVPPLPEPPAAPRHVSKLTEICCLASAVAVLSSNSERGWFTSVLLVFSSVVLVIELLRYVWHKAKNIPAV